MPSVSRGKSAMHDSETNSPHCQKERFAAAVFRRFMSDEFHRDCCKWNRFSELSPQRAFWCYVRILSWNMIDFYILRNVKNVMFHYMPVVTLNNIGDENVRCKLNFNRSQEWWFSFSEHLFESFEFTVMMCRIFHHVAILDSSFKWSIVASATETTWQVPRLMSLIHLNTWHVNQFTKVNMNKFAIINIMFTFKFFVPPILNPSPNSLPSDAMTNIIQVDLISFSLYT